MEAERKMSKEAPVVLVIAGVDPSGGAGIFADFRAIESAGVRAVGAVTALTVQTEKSFFNYEPTSPAMLRATVRGMADAFPIAAVKIGMLADAEVAGTVVELLDEMGVPKVVLDPVIVAAVGARLVDEAAEKVIREELVRRAFLLTPNMPEAAALAGFEVVDLASMREAAEALRASGAVNVVVTGGHLEGDAVDVLATEACLEEIRAPRLPGSVHGTGCAFASATAAALAKGSDVRTAVRAAKGYVETLFKRESWRR
jgi:hydroxymethylpyrimidine/phosphomethylpyrimidine kinase